MIWSYCRNKEGPVEALLSYYPSLVKSEPDLQLAISQIRNAERAIDRFMEQHEANDDWQVRL